MNAVTKTVAQAKRAVWEATERWKEQLQLCDIELQGGWEVSDPNSVAEVEQDSSYLRASVNFDIGKLLTEGEDIERVVVHELAHLVAWPLWEEAKYMKEQLEALGKWNEQLDARLSVANEQVATRIERGVLQLTSSTAQ